MLVFFFLRRLVLPSLCASFVLLHWKALFWQPPEEQPQTTTNLSTTIESWAASRTTTVVVAAAAAVTTTATTTTTSSSSEEEAVAQAAVQELHRLQSLLGCDQTDNEKNKENCSEQTVKDLLLRLQQQEEEQQQQQQKQQDTSKEKEEETAVEENDQDKAEDEEDARKKAQHQEKALHYLLNAAQLRWLIRTHLYPYFGSENADVSTTTTTATTTGTGATGDSSIGRAAASSEEVTNNNNHGGIYSLSSKTGRRPPILTPYRSTKVIPPPEWKDSLFPDFTIAGLHKCGTSHLTHILESYQYSSEEGATAETTMIRRLHPKRYEVFFQNNYTNLDYQASTMDEQTDFQSALYAFHKQLERLQPKPSSSTEQQRHLRQRPSSSSASSSSKTKVLTVTSSPVPADTVLRAHYLRPKKPIKFLMLFRDPADWAWAAWNFWMDEAVDSNHPVAATSESSMELNQTSTSSSGEEDEEKKLHLKHIQSQTAAKWASADMGQYRSPELFHEYLLAGDRHAANGFFHKLRSASIESPRLYKSVFGSANVFMTRSEDMLPQAILQSEAERGTATSNNNNNFLDRLANFTGLKKEGFDSNVINSIHNCNDQKGNKVTCSPDTTLTTGASYSIAGNRPMLPESRQLLYLYFAAECQIWKEEFGIEYPDCLNALP